MLRNLHERYMHLINELSINTFMFTVFITLMLLASAASKEQIYLNISGGIAKMRGETTSEAIIAKADDLLILAKNQGRNQICLWNESTSYKA